MRIDGQIYKSTYKETKNGTKGIFYGRDSDGEKKTWEIEFVPYFFASNSKQQMYSSINKVEKIVTKHPSEVKSARSHCTATYEADVPYVRRVLLDELKSEKFIMPKICFFDIETDRQKNIISLAAYFSDNSKSLFLYGDSDKIIKDFFESIKKYDIITSWTIFDKEVIEATQKFPTEILYLDLYLLFKKLWKKPLKNFKLKTVAELVSDEKIDLDEKIPWFFDIY